MTAPGGDGGGHGGGAPGGGHGGHAGDGAARHMHGYYARALSGERLRRCYELAPPAVRRYLAAEIEFVRARLRPGARVLELGCGYGRVLRKLAAAPCELAGIDTSVDSLRLARRYLGGDGAGDRPPAVLACMDAAALGFGRDAFDVVVCIQNGIAVFGVDRRTLVEEAVRVARRPGTVLFSSYAPGFWEHRLQWFRVQAEHGLIGEIDPDATAGGVIVCRDGFRSTTVGVDEFRALAASIGARTRITEVDGSSLFCELVPG